jgi:carboxylesterase type B
VHIPTSISTTSASNLTYATYANIRFAQPPTGDRRFRAPVTPPPKAHGIQDGKYPLNFTDCMMTAPPYYPFAFAGTSWGHEDCLFLDVKVPAGVKKGDKVPVLHWLYGAGVWYTSRFRWRYKS